MFSHILVASDGSSCAIKAASAAVDLAKKLDVSLLILTVFPMVPMISAFGECSCDLGQEQINEIQSEAIDKTLSVVEGQGIDCAVRREIGYPSEEIVRVAAEENCDLIVLGSRGHSEIWSLLLGSVSERVIHSTTSPVLIVH